MLAALDAFSSNYLQGWFIILLNAFHFFFCADFGNIGDSSG